MALYTLLAVYWIVSGVHFGDTFQWILGAVYLAFIIAYSVYLIIHYKRHPVEDPELDRKAVENVCLCHAWSLVPYGSLSVVQKKQDYPDGVRYHLRIIKKNREFYRDKVNIKPWEVTDFSATGARERRLIQKSKQPKGNLISTAEFYAVNG